MTANHAPPGTDKTAEAAARARGRAAQLDGPELLARRMRYRRHLQALTGEQHR